MSKKLGEILVAGKAVSPGDLKRALDAQLIFGGRLGTNLVELGFLDEATLAAALREQTRVEVATTGMLERATKEALRLIPARVADRHKVVPLEIADKKLKVAMIDPTDLIALDELAFTTSCQIVPFIAPEVKLLAYLERYYKIPRPLRHLKVAAADPVWGSTDAAPASAPADPATPAGPVNTFTERPSGEALTPEGEQVLSLSDVLAAGEAAPEPAERRSRGSVGPAHEELTDPEPVRTLEEAARLLAEAETREDVGDALVAFTQESFVRVMTFVIQRDRALGWLAHLPGRTPPRARQAVRQVVVPFDEPSVVQTVAVSGEYYLGELPARTGDERLVAALGNLRPLNLLILPVKLHGKVVIELYADNADQPITGFDMRALRSLCQKASLAMEVLVLRSRIRQVG